MGMLSSKDDRRRLFVQALGEIGWRGKELARRLEVAEVTVSAWKTGKRPDPGYALAYLRLALAVRTALDGGSY